MPDDAPPAMIELSASGRLMAFRQTDRPAPTGVFCLRSHDPDFLETLPADGGASRLPAHVLARSEQVVASYLWFHDGWPAQVFRPFFFGDGAF